MVRLDFLLGLAISLFLASATNGQSPTPLVSASPTPPTTPARTPSISALIDSLAPADLQQVVPLLKSNFINPAALSDVELERATLEGLMTRLGRGVVLLAERGAIPGEISIPFYNEVLGGHIGYLRLGALTTGNLQAMDTALKNFASQKVDALILDLRASPATNDFATAAEFAKRFCPKGKTLFVLRKPAAKQERAFLSERDPAYQGLIVVLADGETAGAAEALAGALRLYQKAMIIGQPTAGRAVEYSDLPLPSGKILRVAVSEAVLPEGRPLYPDGVIPDLAVEMPAAKKRQIFQQSTSKGMSQFVFETERPHMNEAALLAGTNPEIDAIATAQQGRGSEKEALRDPAMQRAVDLITSLAIYQKH